MPAKKITLDDYIWAILSKDSGRPYPEVLETIEISPTQFFYAITTRLDDLIKYSTGKTKKTLKNISENDDRKTALFDMGKDFITAQYNAIRENMQKRFFKGTYLNRKNLHHLIYHAMTKDLPLLSSPIRIEVIKQINSLNKQLHEYFLGLGLGGMLTHAFDCDEQDSPLAVLKIFDEVYQENTHDVSLFDLDEPSHLHEWQCGGSVPMSYWQDDENIKKVIWHELRENNVLLQSDKRADVVAGLNSLPVNLQTYLFSLGLHSMMNFAFKNKDAGSPLKVIDIFDSIYQDKTGDTSLFNLDQEHHVHRWEIGGRRPEAYWNNHNNVETVVWHKLTEEHPALYGTRSEVIDCITSFPNSLHDYFVSLGLGGLMQLGNSTEKKDSSSSILHVFDRVYTHKTGDKSLFDKSSSKYIEFSKANRLIK